MPTDNWEKERRKNIARAARLDEQWRDGQVVHPAEGDEDAYVRFRLRQEMENKPSKRERFGES